MVRPARPPPLPLSEQPPTQHTILDFLIDSRDIRGNKVGTLRRKALALALQFKYMRHEDPTKWFMIKEFVKGVSKADTGTAVARKLPVGRRHLLTRRRCRNNSRKMKERKK